MFIFYTDVTLTNLSNLQSSNFDKKQNILEISNTGLKHLEFPSKYIDHIFCSF